MKKRFYLAAFAAMALMSCNEKNVEVQQIPVEEGTVELEVNVPMPLTRIAGTAQDSDEKKVNDLQVFVFNSSGVLEAYGNEKANSLKLTCVPGNKEIVALVNAPSLSGVAGLSDIQEEVSELADNAAGSLVMASDVVEAELKADGSNSVTIPVSRIAAKVVLGTVTNNMTLEADQNKDFVIDAVYLINVSGEWLYQSDYDPQLWYNQMKYERDNSVGFLYDAVDKSVSYGSNYSTGHYFYCYPNHTDDDPHAGDWSPRKTRLVVEASLGGEKCFYPLTLVNVDRNTEYVINLTVTRLGSSDPDIPVTTNEATFTVSVMDWIDGGEMDETI